MGWNFSGNRAADDGGALRFGSDLYDTDCVLTIVNCEFASNQSIGGNGGAVTMGTVGDSAAIDCNDVTATSNTANSGEGGFFYLGGAGTDLMVELQGVTTVSAITGNQSDGGGAVSIGPSIGPMEFSCNDINWASNSASSGGKGGAVLLHGLSSGSNMTVEIKNDSTFSNNSASNQGGAIAIENVGDFFLCDITPADTDVEFTNNTGNGGGAVSIEGAGNDCRVHVDGSPASDVLMRNNSGGSRVVVVPYISTHLEMTHLCGLATPDLISMMLLVMGVLYTLDHLALEQPSGLVAIQHLIQPHQQH